MLADFRLVKLGVSGFAKDDAGRLVFREKLSELHLCQPLSNTPCATCLDIEYLFVNAAALPVSAIGYEIFIEHRDLIFASAV